MDIAEMRQLPDDEVSSEIEKARAKAFKMRFQGTGENVEKGSHKEIRRQIARLLTVQKERERARARTAAASAGKDSKA